MRTLIAFLLLCSTAFASPFLVSDPSTEAVGGQYEIQENNTTLILADNEADGSIKFDLKDVAVGTHIYQVRYVITDPIWGTRTSDPVPFEFTRPAHAVGNIKSLKLVQ